MKNTISDYEMYLYLSFLPKFTDANLQWLDCSGVGEFGKGMSNEAWWVSEGVKVLKETMAEEIGRTDPNAIHIVPLSAGLDSRVVLGGLLENLPASQIIAATYGIPGSWDFDVAKDIAGKFGIRHEVFNLLDEKWDVDELIVAANRLKMPVSVHQSYVRQKINNHFGPGCVYWSGFMGDVFDWTGIKTPNTDKRKAIEFLLKPLVTKNYKDQKFFGFIVKKMIDECAWEQLAQTKLTLDLQLMISVQQQQLTGPIVLINGFNFMTPFLNKKWITFSSSIPYKWVSDRTLHKRIIHKGYMNFSKFPTTASAGRPVMASQFEIYLGKVIAKLQPYIMRRDPYFSHPRTNYINWTESLRHKGCLQDSVYITLQDLKKRGILDENDINTWWQDHLSRKTDYTRLLMNLSSLELLLKAGVMV